jgi:hypothetical protein
MGRSRSSSSTAFCRRDGWRSTERSLEQRPQHVGVLSRGPAALLDEAQVEVHRGRDAQRAHKVIGTALGAGSLIASIAIYATI